MQLCHVRREHFQLGVFCGRPWALVQHARGGAAWRGAEMVVRNGVLGLRWQDSRHLEVGDRDIALRRSHLAHLMRTDGLATHRPAVHHHHLHLRDVWREDERGRGGGREWPDAATAARGTATPASHSERKASAAGHTRTRHPSSPSRRRCTRTHRRPSRRASNAETALPAGHSASGCPCDRQRAPWVRWTRLQVAGGDA